MQLWLGESQLPSKFLSVLLDFLNILSYLCLHFSIGEMEDMGWNSHIIISTVGRFIVYSHENNR